MGIKPDAVTASVSIAGTGVSLTWNHSPGDEPVARRVIAFLEDRRVLFGARHLEDEWECVRSTLEIRRFLTDQIASAKPGGSLDASLRAMRAAARQFVDAAGPRGTNFRDQYGGGTATAFGLALGDLRTLIGHQVAILAAAYKLELEPELASVCPPADRDEAKPQDLSWLPGFHEDTD